jgi:tetrahydromethanopterin S-methyltransferase subunit F
MRVTGFAAGMTACMLLMGAPTPAVATLRAIEQAYELQRSQVQLPTQAEGNLTVRPCPTCRLAVLRVTAATGWFSSPGTRQPASQAAVLAAFRAAATNPETRVHVYYEPQTRRVKRIVLDAPAPAVRP